MKQFIRNSYRRLINESNQHRGNIFFRRVRITLVLILGFYLSGLAQEQSSLVIYNKDGIWIRMEIIKPKSPCSDNSPDWRYQITTSGLSKLKPAQRFLSWKIKMVNCSGYMVERVFQVDLKGEHFEDEIALENIDWKFQASSIENSVIDVKIQATEAKMRDINVGVFIPLPVADSIIGTQKITQGDELKLNIASSAPMPAGASWTWYSDACGEEGTPIEKGESIVVSPMYSTTYYVRAELDGKYAACRSFRVAVMDKPEIPDEITNGKASYWGKLFQTDEGDIELYYIKPDQLCSEVPWKLMLRFVGDPVLLLDSKFNYLNWGVTYVDCNKIVHQKSFSLNVGRIGDNSIGAFIENPDWELVAKEIRLRDEAVAFLSESPQETDDQIIGYAQQLIPPDNIVGKTVIKADESTVLSIKDPLPTREIEWVWYQNGCGTDVPLHKGSVLQVKPLQNTTYFVRAEIGRSFSECKAIQVLVQPRTTAPASIVVQTAGKNCPGEAQKLTIQGGYLSENAKWGWYLNSVAPKNLIKSDRTGTVTVYPDKSSTYLVRGEDPEDTTKAVQVSIVVETTPIGPSQIIISNKDSICAGTIVEFTAIGQQLNPRERCRWIIEETKDRPVPIGYGNKISQTLQKSSNIKVYAEGVCENSQPVSRYIPVYENSIIPEFSQVKFETKQNTSKYVLTNTGGRLAPNQSWQWFLGSTPVTLLSSSPTLKIKALEDQMVKLTPSGKCVSGVPLLIDLPKLPPNRYVFANVGGIVSDLSSDHLNNIYTMIGTKKIYLKFTLYELLDKINNANKQQLFTADNTRILSGNLEGATYTFNETDFTNVNMYSAGIMAGIPDFRVYLGAGTGEVEKFTGFDTYDPKTGRFLKSNLARNLETSFGGLALETGIFYNLGIWNFTGGINYIKSSKRNLSLLSFQFGIGMTFKL